VIVFISAFITQATCHRWLVGVLRKNITSFSFGKLVGEFIILFRFLLNGLQVIHQFIALPQKDDRDNQRIIFVLCFTRAIH